MVEETSLAAAWEKLRPHWNITPNDEPLPSTPVYTGLRMFLSPLLRPLLRWKINGAHNIPRSGATILAANHLSHVDPIVVIAAARRTTHYLAKDGHFRNPMTRFVMRATGQIETQREQGGNEALASAANILLEGKALGIFPEGTRSKRNEPPFLLPGKTGVARPLPLTLKRWWCRLPSPAPATSCNLNTTNGLAFGAAFTSTPVRASPG